MKLTKILFLFLALTYSPKIMAQACSCGGAPLLSSLEQPSVASGVWQFGFTYEYSSISDLVFESTKLDDDTRSRKVHSGRLEIGYGLNERFSLSGIFTLLQQERQINSSQTSGDLLQTSGVGDAVLMVKYNLLPLSIDNPRQISIGGGAKLPLGSSDLTHSQQLIAADMQPGTGSWDAIIWGSYYQNFFQLIPLSFNATISYSLTGTNNRFGIDDLGYRFGNEFVATTAVNYHTQSLFDYSIGLRYRSTRADQFDNNDTPNTGGKWLFLFPGFNTKINDSFTARLSSQIPLYRSLVGTQFTTSYTISISLFYTLKNNTKQLSF